MAPSAWHRRASFTIPYVLAACGLLRLGSWRKCIQSGCGIRGVSTPRSPHKQIAQGDLRILQGSPFDREYKLIAEIYGRCVEWGRGAAGSPSRTPVEGLLAPQLSPDSRNPRGQFGVFLCIVLGGHSQAQPAHSAAWERLCVAQSLPPRGVRHSKRSEESKCPWGSWIASVQEMSRLRST
jgi:hypothetical protein